MILSVKDRHRTSHMSVIWLELKAWRVDTEENRSVYRKVAV